MAARPAELAHVHVHSMRVASGAEALVVRAISKRGVAGFGFKFVLEPWVARDMAAWDCAAREAGAPLWRILGGTPRDSVPLVLGTEGLDPWKAGSVEAVLAAAGEATVLVAPHGHPWEIAWCATLAAAIGGGAKVAVPEAPGANSATVSQAPGIGIDWSLEPGFARLTWHAYAP